MQTMADERVQSTDLITGMRKNIHNVIPFIGLIGIIAIFSIITSGRILAVTNMKLIVNQSIILMIACIGVTFVMSMGSLDFSQGSILAITAVVAAVISRQSIIISFIAALAAGAAIGLFNGTLLAKVKIPSFIVTISTLFVFRGLTAFLTRTKPFAIPIAMYGLDNLQFKIIFLAVTLIFGIYLFKYTMFGKHCRAVGAGERAALYAGVRVVNVKTVAFVISGVLAGLCGFMSVIRTGVASPTTGLLFEVDVLTALVLGGLPITGGAKAKIRSGIIGSLMIAFLGNGLVLIGASANILQLVKGVTFLAAVYLSIDREGMVIIK